jgi:putative NADH-flavin reductase
MNIVLYGATGHAGSRILNELVARGHAVKAVTRDPSKIAPTSLVSVAKDDLSDVQKTARIVAGADVVVSSYGPPPTDTDAIIGATNILIKAIEASSPSTRLIVVGGAAGLNVAPGVSLIDSGYLPEAYMPIAKSHLAAFNLLKASSIDWTYFAPAAYFEPGERTGHFRLGLDDLISDAKQQSRISMEDYAIALVDELEKPAHRRQRFTAGY